MTPRLFTQKIGFFTLCIFALIWRVNFAQMASEATYYIATSYIATSGADANSGTA